MPDTSNQLPWLPLKCDACGTDIGECKLRPHFAYCNSCAGDNVKKHMPIVPMSRARIME